MIYFLLGIIIGILVRDIKYKFITTVESIQEDLKPIEPTQFFEPVTLEEKWNKAKSVDDLLDKKQ